MDQCSDTNSAVYLSILPLIEYFSPLLRLYLGSQVPTYSPPTVKLKFAPNWQMLKINFSKNSLKYSKNFIIKLTNFKIKKYVVVVMLPSYPSCNIHLIPKSFAGLMYIRVVPRNTLELKLAQSMFYDTNLNGQIIGLTCTLASLWVGLILKGDFASRRFWWFSALYVYTKVCVVYLIFYNIYYFNSSFYPKLIKVKCLVS